MKHIYLMLNFLTAFLFYNISLFGQSVTIDYSFANLGTSCNVFAQPTTFAGHVQQTSFGFPYFSQPDGAIVLQSQPISSTLQGATQYSIAYPFKQGYTYQIMLYGKSVLGSTNSMLPSAAIFWSNSNGGVNTSTNCTGPASESSAFDANYGHMAFTTSWSWSPNLINGIALQNYNFLLIAAVPFSSNYVNDQTISSTYIQKIQITEIPPQPSFSMASPSPANFTCGVTPQPQISFSTNPLNIPQGATLSYTWNLGANNGWQYNGAAASATINTGATNGLTLTPTCGSTLSPVSATVTVNGTAYNTTNSASVGITQPSLNLVPGVTSLCSGSTPLTITGLPCNASVAWIVSPATGVANLGSTTGNSNNLQAVGSGNVTVTATVTACGVQTPLTQTVHVGSYQASDYTVSASGTADGSPLNWCPNQSYTFSVNGNGSNYSWSVPSGWTISSGGNSNLMVALSPVSNFMGSGASVGVNFSEPCSGALVSVSKPVTYNTSGCALVSYVITPNPVTTGNINVAAIANPNYPAYAVIKFIQITCIVGSGQGIMYYNQQFYTPVQNTNIYVGNYPSGVYMAQISPDGYNWYTVTFVKP